MKGNIRFADYQFILAHPDIMPEMLALRGLLKKKFPSAKNETLGMNLFELVSKFMNGLFISGRRDEFQENFGIVNTCIGTVRKLNISFNAKNSTFKLILFENCSSKLNFLGKFIQSLIFRSLICRPIN